MTPDAMLTVAPNGAPPAPETPAPPAQGPIPGTPPGTLVVSPQTHATLVRLVQQHQVIADVLRAYLDAKEVTDPHVLAIPMFLLVPQKEG